MTVEDDLILHLMTIEEDIATLDYMIENGSLQNKDAIQNLLQQIASLAVLSRQKALALASDIALEDDVQNIVTKKEIQELLEDFA